MTETPNEPNMKQVLEFVHLVTPEPHEQLLVLVMGAVEMVERRYGPAQAPTALLTLLRPAIDGWQQQAQPSGALDDVGPLTMAVQAFAASRTVHRPAAIGALLGAAASMLSQDFTNERAAEIVSDAMKHSLALAEPKGNA